MVRTEILFVTLLKELDVDCICDIGSMDGKHSRLFQAACPNARIIAFEANPYNYRRMIANSDLAAVAKHHLAVSDRDGTAPFYIVDAHYDKDGPDRGRSSLLPGKHAAQVEVKVARLDTVFTTHAWKAARLALWVDAEGAGWEVLNGCGALAERVTVIHVEVEQQPLRDGQRLYPEVVKLLRLLDFEPVATNWRGSQGDILAVRRDVLSRQKWGITRAIARARIVSTLRIQPLLHAVLPRRLYDAAKQTYARHFA